MTFPVVSTEYETAAVKNIARVMNRSKVANLIDRAGCYACRSVAGTSTPSQHSYGNALDFFPKQHLNQTDARDAIFHNVIIQATKKTIANRGKKLPIHLLINHDALLQWTPSGGIQHYGGLTGDHVHADPFPQYTGACGRRP